MSFHLSPPRRDFNGQLVQCRSSVYSRTQGLIQSEDLTNISHAELIIPSSVVRVGGILAYADQARTSAK